MVDADVGPVMASMFDHVLVDEYQDTSTVQADVLRALRRADTRITVVGDDAQAIYSFRAASVRNILDFPLHFPGASTVTLEQNYRSTRPILALANAVMAEAAEVIGSACGPIRTGECDPCSRPARINNVRQMRCARPSSNTMKREWR